MTSFPAMHCADRGEGNARWRAARSVIPSSTQLPTAETLTVEFKADRKEPLKDRDLALAAICLANAQGGTLYLGIEDNGTITGLHPGRDRSKNLAAVIAEFTTPPLGVTVECLELNRPCGAADRCSRRSGNGVQPRWALPRAY